MASLYSASLKTHLPITWLIYPFSTPSPLIPMNYVAIKSYLLPSPAPQSWAPRTERKRALAMMIAASGSSVGAVIHPLMLNNILNGRLHFANSARASVGLLLVACSLMRTRLPIQKKPVQQRQILRNLLHDNAYIAASLGSMLMFLTLCAAILTFNL